MVRLLGFLGPLLVAFAAACSMPPGMNDDCNPPAQLLTRAHHVRTDRAHLVGDVKVIEELAMRHADSQGKGAPGSRRRQLACEAKLFGVIATTHGVMLSTIADARQQLDRRTWDATVHLPLLAFYFGAAILLARRIRWRFPDEKLPAAVATAFGSILAGGVFLALAHLWHGLVEMIRLGTTHLSYRTARLGWGDHSVEVFALAVLLFWCAVLGAYRGWDRSDDSDSDMRVLGVTKR